MPSNNFRKRFSVVFVSLSALFGSSLAYAEPQVLGEQMDNPESFVVPPAPMSIYQSISDVDKKKEIQVELDATQKIELQKKTFEKEMLKVDIELFKLQEEQKELKNKNKGLIPLSSKEVIKKESTEEIEAVKEEVNTEIASYSEMLRRKTLEAMSYVDVSGIGTDLTATVYFNGGNILVKESGELPGGWVVSNIEPYALKVTHPQSPGLIVDIQIRSPFMTDEKLKQQFGFSSDEEEKAPPPSAYTPPPMPGLGVMPDPLMLPMR